MASLEKKNLENKFGTFKGEVDCGGFGTITIISKDNQRFTAQAKTIPYSLKKGDIIEVYYKVDKDHNYLIVGCTHPGRLS